MQGYKLGVCIACCNTVLVVFLGINQVYLLCTAPYNNTKTATTAAHREVHPASRHEGSLQEEEEEEESIATGHYHEGANSKASQVYTPSGSFSGTVTRKKWPPGLRSAPTCIFITCCSSWHAFDIECLQKLHSIIQAGHEVLHCAKCRAGLCSCNNLTLQQLISAVLPAFRHLL